MRYPQTIPPSLPDWMKVPLKFATPEEDATASVRKIIHGSRLNTVCEESACPNLGHCWSRGTATFMIMGDRCTRRCGFCNVQTAKPLALDAGEAQRVARAVKEMRLKHAVITSVDRDDLKDGGSVHFAGVISRVKEENPTITLEVLIPDFKGQQEHLSHIWVAGPHIINHNVETVPALYESICPQSNYATSLKTLRLAGEAGFTTKSGLILGLGEKIAAVRSVLDDLRENGVVMLTIGQYLQPSTKHAPLKEYVSLDTFAELKEYGYKAGFHHIESGPLVRSSYHAGDALERLPGIQSEIDNKI